MYIAVNNDISDADKFWAAAQQELSNLPPNLKLHQCIPVTGGKTAFCLWEVDSIEALREWMERVTEGMSRNEYYQVEMERAIGLPGSTQTSQAAATSASG